MKFLKFAILSGKDIWKHKWAYVLLIFQLILVEILLLSFGSRLQGVYESRKLCNAFNGENMYYYTQYQYTKNTLDNILSKEILDKIEIVEMPLMAISEENGTDYVACGYMDRVIEACEYDLTEGKWFSEYEGSNIPAISTDPDIRVGTSFSVGRGENSCVVEIIGYLDADSYVLYFCGGSSSGLGGLDQFVSHPSFQLILPYQSQKWNSITEKATDYMEVCNQSMLFVSDSDVVERLLEESHDYGAVTDINTMKHNYDTDIKNDFILNGTILLVFAILSITGLIGFHGIQSAKHEREYLIYYFLGGKNRDFVVIEILKNGVVFVMSFGIFMFLFRKMDLFTYSQNELQRISWQAIVGVFLVISLICVTTSLWYIRRLAHTQWITAYKFKS